MSRSPHLFVALSGHGFGHLAQSAPALRALRQRLPSLRLSVQSSLPSAVLYERIGRDLEHIMEAADPGMVMANALDVEVQASLEAYRAFHAAWEIHLARQQQLLMRLKPDLVLSDIPYLPLAAASWLGIPALALSSLNWADVLLAYSKADQELAALRNTMLDAYHNAAVFLCPEPSMPMPEINNTQPIGPIAAIGRQRRAELNAKLRLQGDETLVLIGLGGVDFRLPVERWPSMPKVRWLAPAAWSVKRPDIIYREAVAEIPFMDLLRSCDVLLTKPGYGSFTEAACNATRVLYVERNDWPEEPGLSNWLAVHGNAVSISRQHLEAGNLQAPLQALLAQPKRPTLKPSGIEEAVAYLASYLPANR